MRQTVRMLLYRWRLFALVFVLVFAGCLGVLLYLEHDNAEPELELESELESVYMSEIAFYNPNYLGDMEFYRFMTADILDGPAARTLLDQTVTIQVKAVGNTVNIALTGPDRQRLSQVGNSVCEIASTLLNAELPGWIYIQTATKEQISVEGLTPPPSTSKATLGFIFNLIIAFTLASLCAIMAVFTRENLDKSIRSVYHLKKTVNIPVLPVISPVCRESELFALVGALPIDKPVLLCGISRDSDSPELAVRLAEAVACEGCVVAVVDFIGGAISDNPYVTIVASHTKKAVDCLSESFFQEIDELRKQYGLVILAAPSVNNSGIGVALSKIAAAVLLVRWGKTNDEQLQFAAGLFGGRPDVLAGIVIIGYRPNVEYIWEG